MQIDITPCTAFTPKGLRVMYDLTINGKAIKGSRVFTKAEAEQERDIMLRSKVWKNAQQFLE